MRGFKSFASAERFCRSYDELRNLLRLRARHNQPVPPTAAACFIFAALRLCLRSSRPSRPNTLASHIIKFGARSARTGLSATLELSVPRSIAHAKQSGIRVSLPARASSLASDAPKHPTTRAIVGYVHVCLRLWPSPILSSWPY
jgi:hypothetical protein